MKIDLNQKITDIKGNVSRLSFPSEQEKEAAGGDLSKLPDETLGNVIVNCLAAFPVKERKQIFTINDIASRIVNSEDGTIDVSPEEQVLLGDILFAQTFQEDEKGQNKGVYLHYIINQAMKMLGVE